MHQQSPPATSDLIGRTGAPYPVTVVSGQLAAFAVATRARSTDHLIGAGATIPPTALSAATFWPDRNHAAYSCPPDRWARLLYGEQEYIFHGPPPRAGQELVAQQHVEDRYVKQGRRSGSMTCTVVVTEFRSADGTLVAEGRATIIETD